MKLAGHSSHAHLFGRNWRSIRYAGQPLVMDFLQVVNEQTIYDVEE